MELNLKYDIYIDSTRTIKDELELKEEIEKEIENGQLKDVLKIIKTFIEIKIKSNQIKI